MKANKNIKILLPIVLVIWGILIYNIFNAFGPSKRATTTTKVSSFHTPKVQEIDTFSLLPIDEDPFFGTTYLKPEKKSAPGALPISNQEITWPLVDYKGIVEDMAGESPVYVLDIDGEQFLLQKGDTIRQLKVLGGTEESIKIRYKRKTRKFDLM